MEILKLKKKPRGKLMFGMVFVSKNEPLKSNIHFTEKQQAPTIST